MCRKQGIILYTVSLTINMISVQTALFRVMERHFGPLLAKKMMP
jgi:hypothetical protein